MLLGSCEEQCIMGCSRKLGASSVLEAELWAIYFGLKRSRNMNIKHLELCLDSACSIKFLSSHVSNVKIKYTNALNACKQVIQLLESFIATYSWRETNALPDLLASKIHDMEEDFWLAFIPPAFVRQTLFRDVSPYVYT